MIHVAIIGAGPAGLFAAYEFQNLGASVHVFERGPKAENRFCPDYRCHICPFQDNCAILCGEGGAGGYSDGKLTLSSGRGIQAGADELGLGNYKMALANVGDICEAFGDMPISENLTTVPRPALLDGSPFEFESFPLRLYGTKGIRILFSRMRSHLERLGAVFHFNSEVNALYPGANHRAVIHYIDRSEAASTELIKDVYDHVVLAAGSYSNTFSEMIAEAYNVKLSDDGAAGIGIRLEAEDKFLAPMIAEFYDFKLYLTHPSPSGDIHYRSFCVNRSGTIVNEKHNSLVSVNGRSTDNPTGRSNLAIIAKINNGKRLVRNLAKLMNQVGHGLPLVQFGWEFLRDFIDDNHDRSGLINARNNSTYGDIVSILPLEIANGFRTYLTELEQIMPMSVWDKNSLIYAPEIKYHMPSWPLGEGFVVEGCPGLQVIGNSAGYTDSISTAAVMGLVAARHIMA